MIVMRIAVLGVAIVAVSVAAVPGPTLAQGMTVVSGPRCRLVSMADFGAARLPAPGKLIVAAPPPNEECRAFYGTGQMAGVITVAVTQPMLPFPQMLQACRKLQSPCTPVAGVGDGAFYDRTGAKTGYGSMQEVMASVHRRIEAVRSVGMPGPIAESALVALARIVALRQR